MRILVFSDSHGNSRCMSEALYSNPNAEMIIHLGDGERDLNDIGDAVAGGANTAERLSFSSPKTLRLM